MAKNKVKQAKPKMVHKPLKKTGDGGGASAPVAAKPKKKTEQSIDAWSVSYVAAQRETTARERGLVESLIAALPNAIFDPEKSAGEISRKLWRLDKTIPPETERLISDGLAEAHSNRVGHLLGVMKTHDEPERVQSQINGSVEALRLSGQLERLYKKMEVVDRAGLDKKLKEAFDARYAAIAEQRTQAAITEAQQLFAHLQKTQTPDPVKEKLTATLDRLGDQQVKAFPAGVETREAMDKRIAEAYDAAVQRQQEAMKAERAVGARFKFEELGKGGWWSLRAKNPDAELAGLRLAIAQDCDGDIMRIVSKSTLTTIDAVEKAISEKHDAGIERVAASLLESRGIYAPSTGYWGADLKKVQEIAATGHSPAAALKEIEEDRYSYLRSSKPTDKDVIATIRKADEPHAAVRFALVAQHYAARGEPHEGILTKTRQRVEAAGGVEALAGSAALLKIGDKEWTDVKALLAVKLEPAPEAVPSMPVQSEVVVAPAPVVIVAAAAALLTDRVNGGASVKANGSSNVAVVMTGAGNGAVPVEGAKPKVPVKPPVFTRRTGDWSEFLASVAPKPPA